jgi:Domain of unknown function (DU1801)
MQSSAQFVEQYLASLPEDRRIAIEKIRSVILANLDGNIEEGMQYGMIGYYVPHRIYPAGYHCDPKQPLPYAGLASQKNHMSIYMMTIYGDPNHLKWFESAWKKTGKKLDMGKSCIRFKKLEDVALEVIGEAFKRIPASAYIATYERVLKRPDQGGMKPTAKKKVTPTAKVAKKTLVTKPTKKAVKVIKKKTVSNNAAKKKAR